MSSNFLDTSAWAKRYHQEIGTAAIDRLFADKPSRHLISQLSIVEIYSTFAKKVRMGIITEEDFIVLERRLTFDLEHRIVHVINLREEHYLQAANLIKQYGYRQELRTLDALQAAVGLDLHQQRLLDRFLSADKALYRLGKEMGLPMVDPEAEDHGGDK